MKTTHPDMSYIFFTIIIIILSTIIQIKSEEYTVGDDDEWTTGVNYYAWSQKYHFAVGDIIGGMRFGIDVTKASSSPPSPAPEITPPPNTGDKLAQGKGIACALLGAFGTYFFIY
ncbi:hypothetical protein IFM89_001890 [Coptis chinensis]|uniref:Uncharacterized protein n=1 Tax=Coptis chinensis TaxID=261450 RepID=A0A835M992_9MAGN|nr:hypothetical protein IFM89_001890 [Coptis chinensis]